MDRDTHKIKQVNAICKLLEDSHKAEPWKLAGAFDDAQVCAGALLTVLANVATHDRQAALKMCGAIIEALSAFLSDHCAGKVNLFNPKGTSDGEK